MKLVRASTRPLCIASRCVRPAVAHRQYSTAPSDSGSGKMMSLVSFTLEADSFSAPDMEIELPLSIIGKSGEIACGFFYAAYKKGGEKTVALFEKELNILTWSVRGDSKWEAETQSPFFDKEHKIQVVREKCQELKLSPFFTSRLADLIQYDMDVDILEQVRTDYEEIMRAFRKERVVTLFTNSSLTSEEFEFWKNNIKLNYFKADEVILFDHKVDDTILGGFKLRIDKTDQDHTWNKSASNLDQQLLAQDRAKFEAAKIALLVPTVDEESDKFTNQLFEAADELSRGTDQFLSPEAQKLTRPPKFSKDSVKMEMVQEKISEVNAFVASRLAVAPHFFKLRQLWSQL